MKACMHVCMYAWLPLRNQCVGSYCEIYGMSMNMKKTKFMVINGTTEDKKEKMSRNVIFKHCDSYIYLGSPVTWTIQFSR